MQNWKIKRMSYKRINAWIKEIGHLLDYYERKKRLDVCGLCTIAGLGIHECRNCLWQIIEGKKCFALKRELGYSICITDARNCKRWREARIPMLRRWKKILQAEKDARTEGGG